MKNKKNSHQVVYYYEGIDNLTEHHFLSMVSNMKKLTGSNKYISQYLFTSVTYVSKLVKKLKEGGYINVTLVANQYRTITLTDKCVKMIFTPIQSDREVKKSTTPIVESTTPPNTNDNPPLSKVLPPIVQSTTNNIVDKKEDKIEDVIADDIDNNIVAEDITDEIFMKPIKTNQIDEVEFNIRINEPNEFMDELDISNLTFSSI